MPEEEEPEDLFEGEEYQQTDPRDKSRMSPDRLESPLHGDDMADQIEEELDLQGPYQEHEDQFSPDIGLRPDEEMASNSQEEEESPEQDHRMSSEPKDSKHETHSMKLSGSKSQSGAHPSTTKAPKDENQLAPLQLQNENLELKRELEKQHLKLAKTEEKLERKRKFIQEMSSLQNDISQIKKSTQQEVALKKQPSQGALSGTEEQEKLQAENQALQARLREVQSRLKDGDDQQVMQMEELRQMR